MKTTLNKSGVLFILLLLSIVHCLNAQAPLPKAWDKTYGGGGDDYLEHMIETGDGGYLLAGYSSSGAYDNKSSNTRGGNDFWVIKLKADGSKEWDKSYGGSNDDALTTLTPTADGGYLLGGFSASGRGFDKSEVARGNYDYWVVKIDKNGAKEWDKTFGTVNYDYLESVTVTKDGGYLLGGYTATGTSSDKTDLEKGGMDYWVIKLRSNGSKEWDRTYGGSGDDILTTIIPVAAGGYLLGGSSFMGTGFDKSEPNKGNVDYWVIKIKEDGDKEWDRTLGASGTDIFTSMMEMPGGGFMLVGHSDSGAGNDKTEASKGEYDNWVIKLNADGSKVWDKTFGGISNDYASSIIRSEDGEYMIGGHSYSEVGSDKSENVRGGADFWVVKFNSEGNKIWDSTFGGTDGDYLTSLISTADNGYLFGGMSTSGVGGDKTGTNNGLADFWVVKLGNIEEPEIPVNPEVPVEPEERLENCLPTDFTIYPNPTAGKVWFSIGDKCLTTSKFDLIIINSIGQEWKLKQQISIHEEVDISGFDTSLYLFVLTFAENKQIVKKVMKIN